MNEPKRLHREYARGLTEDERLLIGLRDELYSGDWGWLLKALGDGLKLRPYIFKRDGLLRRHIALANKLQAYEREHGVDLADYLPDSLSASRKAR